MKINDSLRRTFRFLRPFVIYFMFLFISGVVNASLQSACSMSNIRDYDYIQTVYSVLYFIMLFAVLNTVVLIFSANDVETKLGYFKNGKKKSTLRELFRSKDILTQTVTVAALVLVLPQDFGYKSLSLIIFGGSAIPLVLQKMIIALAVTSVFWLFTVKSRRAAERVWHPMFAEESLEREIWRSVGKAMLKLFLSLVMYSIGFLALPIIILFALGIIALGIAGILIIALCIFALTIFPITIGTLNKRRKCIRRIRKTCSECNYQISKIRRKYLSVFWNSGGYNFSVVIGGETYYCKFISSVFKNNYIYFETDGHCRRYFIVSFAKVEFLRLSFETKYDFECGDGKKIIIISPVARGMFIGTANENRDLDNGDRIDEYTFYSASGFCNAAEHNCFEKNTQK